MLLIYDQVHTMPKNLCIMRGRCNTTDNPKSKCRDCDTKADHNCDICEPWLNDRCNRCYKDVRNNRFTILHWLNEFD